MKRWLLYFFVFTALLGIIPTAAQRLVGREFEVSVNINGETVNMPCEEFVARVLLGEGGICESAESKKALAIALRSIALNFQVYGGKHDGFDFCDDATCCYNIGALESCDGEILSAVEATKGIILTYEKTPAMALFTVCTGSCSSKPDFENGLSPIREEVRCEIHKTENTLPYNNIIENPSGAVLVYDDNNDCSFAVWDGKYISGAELRDKLSLPSTEFTLEFRDDGICAISYGLGNGYGMSLCGAESMAKNGSTFEEILAFYYPNFVLKTDNLNGFLKKSA